MNSNSRVATTGSVVMDVIGNSFITFTISLDDTVPSGITPAPVAKYWVIMQYHIIGIPKGARTKEISPGHTPTLFMHRDDTSFKIRSSCIDQE